MNDLTIGQITAVTNEVRRRVALLETFTDRINDDRTYEISGEESVHRLLERAMWIVDERYWLMHSNRQLRTVVADQMAKEDKKFEKHRPDFVCGTVDKRLIIIEIKRPSHVLTVKDLNQLERYVVLCEEYDDEHSSFEAILVGSKVSEDLRRTLKVRGASFKARTYTQLVTDTRRRYTKYLEALET
jgi:RecB family endonuclease NucS